jgi:NAD(P)-dependent dehydrogenase (short-subunit alcohol dehydrogenase family)
MGERHVIVTGAGTGIGRAIALRLAGPEVRMSLLARNRDRLDETAQMLEESGSKVFTASCDIRDRVSVDGVFEQAAGACGPISVLVANAGAGGSNEPGPTDRFEDVVRTNLDGTYSCLRAAQRHLAEGPDARHLVVISSILARIGVPGYTAYCASKAGLLGLVRALAAELAPDNVQVNAVCPGWVDTAMAHEGLAGMAEGMGITKDEAHTIAMQQVPLGRMSQPEDVAGLVNWLASDDARGVTGQALDMNGGAFMI